MISFVTAVKLMPGYEDYQKRLEMYVECIAAHCVCEYEIGGKPSVAPRLLSS